MKKGKNFFYRINPNEVLGEVIFASNKEEWFLQFFDDLRRDDAETAKIPLAAEIIRESDAFRAKRSKAGLASVQQKVNTSQHMLNKCSDVLQQKSTSISISSNSSNRNSTVSETITEPKERPLKPLSEYSDDFVTFWKSYPKKTAKGSAWLEWKKHKPPLEKVLESLEWQKTSKKWQEGFILDPERYIKKRCWEDEPTDTIIPEGYASKGVMGALMRSAELRQRAQQQEVIDAT